MWLTSIFTFSIALALFYLYIQYYLRPSYCDSPFKNCLTFYPYFYKLPPMPRDFDVMKTLFKAGRVDPSLISEEYWKQPEWYEDFITSGVMLYKGYPPKSCWIQAINEPIPENCLIRSLIDEERISCCYPREVSFGYRAYPSERTIVISKGKEINLTIYLYASWTVSNYQGMQLIAAFPDSVLIWGEMDGKKSFEQDPEETKKYFDVKVNPKVILLGPTYPTFESEWTKRIMIKIRSKVETPKGYYIISLNPTKPPAEMEKKWRSSYANYISIEGKGKPPSTLVVKIV